MSRTALLALLLAGCHVAPGASRLDHGGAGGGAPGGDLRQVVGLAGSIPIRFDPEERYLAFRGADSTALSVFDASDGSSRLVHPAPDYFSQGPVLFGPGGTLAFRVREPDQPIRPPYTTTVHAYDLARATEHQIDAGLWRDAWSFLPDGRLVGIGPSGSLQLMAIDAGSGQLLRDGVTGDYFPTFSAFVPVRADGGQLAYRTRLGDLELLDLPGQGITATGVAAEPGSLRYDDRGRVIFETSVSAARSLRVFDPATGAVVATPPGDAVLASTGGAWLVSLVPNATLGHDLHLTDSTTGEDHLIPGSFAPLGLAASRRYLTALSASGPAPSGMSLDLVELATQEVIPVAHDGCYLTAALLDPSDATLLFQARCPEELELRRMDIASRVTTTVASPASLRAFEPTGQAALVLTYSGSSNEQTFLRLDLATGATTELARTRTDVHLSPSGSRFLALQDTGDGPVELRLIDLATASTQVLERGSDMDPVSSAIALVGETRVAYTTRAGLVVFGPR